MLTLGPTTITYLDLGADLATFDIPMPSQPGYLFGLSLVQQQNWDSIAQDPYVVTDFIRAPAAPFQLDPGQAIDNASNNFSTSNPTPAIGVLNISAITSRAGDLVRLTLHTNTPLPTFTQGTLRVALFFQPCTLP